MKIMTWKKSGEHQQPGFMVRVNKDEAIKIIASLSMQIDDNDCNARRIEFITDKHEYFSISVQ